MGYEIKRTGIWRFAAPLALFGLSLFFWHAYYEAVFRGLIFNDALDYASLARNFALGKGLVSQYLTPLGLAHLGVPQPDIWRAPLWPVILAAFQKVFGFVDEASALAGGFFFAAGTVLVYMTGRLWFNGAVALAASLMYVFSSAILGFSVSGLTEPLAVFLMLLWLYTLIALNPRSWSYPLLAGVAIGVFFLARYNAVLFLLPGIVFVCWRFWGIRKVRWFAFSPRAVLPAAVFLLGFLLAAGPWLGRNWVLAGDPFFTLQKYEPAMFTRTYPDYSLYMHPEKIDVVSFSLEHPEELRAKVAAGWREFLKDFYSPEFTGVAVPVFLLFLISLIFPFDRKFPAQKGVRPLVVACFLMQLAAVLPVHYIPRLFIFFAPVYMIYAASAVFSVVDAIMRRFRAAGWLAGGTGGRALAPAALAAFVFFAVYLNYPEFRPVLEGPHPLTLRAEALRDVERMVPSGRVVVSDIGHLFAWYGKRFACKLTYSPELLPELKKRAPVGALYLSNWITWDVPEADPSWIRLYLEKPRSLAGLRLVKVYADGSLLYIL